MCSVQIHRVWMEIWEVEQGNGRVTLHSVRGRWSESRDSRVPAGQNGPVSALTRGWVTQALLKWLRQVWNDFGRISVAFSPLCLGLAPWFLCQHFLAFSPVVIKLWRARKWYLFLDCCIFKTRVIHVFFLSRTLAPFLTNSTRFFR